MPPPELGQSHYFTYRGDLETHFSYPIPIRDAGDFSALETGPLHILCRTQRLFLGKGKHFKIYISPFGLYDS